MSDRIADLLVLVMTPGVSLRVWRETGLLAREWAIYQLLSDRFARVVVLSDGSEEDEMIAEALGVDFVGLDDAGGLARAAELVAGKVADAKTAVVKTNQHAGGSRALEVTRELRDAGLCAALVARGGHLRSMNVARREGFASEAAAQAADDERLLLHSADHVVAATEAMGELLCWRYAIEPSMVSAVPNYFIPPADPTILDEPAIERDPRLVLAAGRLAHEKRLPIVLSAMRELGRDVRLSIAGDGPDRDELSALAEAYEINATFHGAQLHAELSRLMLEAGVFVQMSAYEWHPKTVIEAMACGCAVVVADAPGLRETVLHGETGLVVGADAGELSNAVRGLLEDGARREALGARAREWATERFAIANVLSLEVRAMEAAIEHARVSAQSTLTRLRRRERRARTSRVRFDSGLTAADPNAVARAFEDCVHGFVKRVAPDVAAQMLAELDARLYTIQGEAAVKANGGLHPKHEILRFHDFFVERIEAGDRVLDLGSGIGALAVSIADRCGAGVTCIEINPNNVEIARDRCTDAGVQGRVEVVEGDITTDRAEGSFDVVVLSNVLEHLPDRSALLRQWRAWYQPRAFLIRVPAFERDWRVAWKRKLGVEWRLDPTHEVEHTADQLREELAEGGLEIVECTTQWGEYWLVARPIAGEQSAAA